MIPYVFAGSVGSLVQHAAQLAVAGLGDGLTLAVGGAGLGGAGDRPGEGDEPVGIREAPGPADG